MKPLLLVLSSLAFVAQAQTPTPAASEAPAPKRREVKIQHLLVKPPETEAAENPITVEQTCTNEAGAVLKKGDVGFEPCLARVAAEAQRKSMNREAIGPAKPNEASAGANLNFKIGK